MSEPVGLPPEAAAALPNSRPGPLLPAAARVAIYLVAWGGAWILAQLITIVVLGLLVHGPERFIQLAQELSSDPLALGWPVIAAVQWSGFLATLLVTWLMLRFLDRTSVRALGFWPTRGQLLDWLLGVVLGGLLFATILAVGVLAGWFQVAPAAPAPSPWLVPAAILILLPAAAVEEITMRGYVLRVLRERYGWRWALGVSALLFAALHASNPGFSPGAVAGLIASGIYLGAAYLITGRLYLPIALHTAWNLFEGPVFGFRVSGIQTPSLLVVRDVGPPFWTGGAFGPEAGLLLTLALVVHLPLLVCVARQLPGSRSRVDPPTPA